MIRSAVLFAVGLAIASCHSVERPVAAEPSEEDCDAGAYEHHFHPNLGRSPYDAGPPCRVTMFGTICEDGRL